MEITYRYTPEDFVDAVRTAARTDPGWGRHRRMIGYLGIALVVLPFLAGGSFSHPETALFGFWLIAPVLIYSSFFYPWKAYVRKMYAPNLKDEEYRAEITESGITTKSPTTRIEMTWTAFSRSQEGELVFSLYTGGVFYMFPKRAFGPGQEDEFRALLSKHIVPSR